MKSPHYRLFIINPIQQRHITYEEIKQLAEAIRKPPYLLDTDILWNAYEQLKKSKLGRQDQQNS